MEEQPYSEMSPLRAYQNTYPAIDDSANLRHRDTPHNTPPKDVERSLAFGDEAHRDLGGSLPPLDALALEFVKEVDVSTYPNVPNSFGVLSMKNASSLAQSL